MEAFPLQVKARQLDDVRLVVDDQDQFARHFP
jgi:hypothetical protein